MQPASLVESRPRWREALDQRFELARGGVGHNVRPMEGLRGLAVFLVFLVHYVTLSMPLVPPGSALARGAALLHAMGNVGVDLFFVLSGYLIYGSLVARRQAYGPFIWRRVVRIYPAFLVVFALYLVLTVVFPGESKVPKDPEAAALYLLANLLLLPGLAPIEPMIAVAWSLSYEFFYYLVMPVLVTLLALQRRRSMTRVLLFSSLWLVGLLVASALGGPVRLLMFVPGILLHEWLLLAPRSQGRSAFGAAALVLALALAAVPAPGPAGQALKVSGLGLLFLVACRCSFSDPQGWLARGLSWTPMRWLGNSSYSYYLIHGVALKALFMLVGRWWPTPANAPGGLFWWWLPMAFAWTCIPAVALFLWIERPLSLTPKVRAGRLAGAKSA